MSSAAVYHFGRHRQGHLPALQGLQGLTDRHFNNGTISYGRSAVAMLYEYLFLPVAVALHTTIEQGYFFMAFTIASTKSGVKVILVLRAFQNLFLPGRATLPYWSRRTRQNLLHGTGMLAITMCLQSVYACGPFLLFPQCHYNCWLPGRAAELRLRWW